MPNIFVHRHPGHSGYLAHVRDRTLLVLSWLILSSCTPESPEAAVTVGREFPIEVALTPIVFDSRSVSSRHDVVSVPNRTSEHWSITGVRQGCACQQCELVTRSVPPGAFCELNVTTALIASPEIRKVDLWLLRGVAPAIPVHIVSPQYPEISVDPVD
jgi:hypothetical protein